MLSSSSDGFKVSSWNYFRFGDPSVNINKTILNVEGIPNQFRLLK